MGRIITAVFTAVAIALSGCHVSTEPSTVATLGEKHAPSMTRAPWRGTFTLYRSPTGQPAQKAVAQSVHLQKDEQLGFRVRESGVVAVAGDLELPVSDGAYEWVMTPDPGQINPVTTTILVVAIVAAAALVAIVVWTAIDAANTPLFSWN